MHEINLFDYKENVDQQEVENELNAYATENGDWFQGLPSSIHWLKDKVFESREDAENYINEKDGWYNQMAVKYKRYDIKISTKLKRIEERLKNENKKLYELENHKHYTPETMKSKYLGCKSCGSKIAVKYLNSNLCPICNKDLRPDNVKKKIAKLKDNISQLHQDKINEEKECRKHSQYEINWLVKIEYHV